MGYPTRFAAPLILTCSLLFSAAAQVDAPPAEQPEAGQASAPLADSANEGSVHAWLGTWTTTFGELELSLNANGEVEGPYGGGRVLSGRLDGERLRFRYVEPAVQGEGWFELGPDGKTFEGKWRPFAAGNGIEQPWRNWKGKLAVAAPGGFEGLWATTFGRMRLTQSDERVAGAYALGPNSTIEGTVDGTRLEFTYDEGEARGEGWFELSPDRNNFRGQWRVKGSKNWRPWKGERIFAQSGVRWLLILEARWETSLSDREYAFGDMLESYFTMAPAKHVAVRHRFFHDKADFHRFAREAKYLPGPVTVVVSSHGSERGVSVNGSTLSAEDIAKAMGQASNVDLLHLSGCSMMSGSVPDEIHKHLGEAALFPISGYAEGVAWDASAISDFVYLSMVLIRRMNPEDAVAQTHLVAPYTGAKRLKGAAFMPMGLSIRSVPALE